MQPSKITTLAKRLDDIEIQSWVHRLEEVENIIRRAEPSTVESKSKQQSCTWETPQRKITFSVSSDGVHRLDSSQQAFRAAFSIEEAARAEAQMGKPDDRDYLLNFIKRQISTLEAAFPDEGCDDVPGGTWDNLQRSLHLLADDLLCFLADLYGRADPEHVEMMQEHPFTLLTGEPFGPPKLVIHIGDKKVSMLTDHGTSIVNTMVNPLICISSPKPRVLQIGPASIDRGPWVDPGPVDKMRGIKRFRTSRKSEIASA